MTALDAKTDQVKGKLAGLFQPIQRPAATFERHLVDQLRLLGQVSTQLEGTTTRLSEMGAAATTAGTGLRGIRAPADAASGSLGRMAGTAAGIGLLVTTLRSLGEILKDARDYARETAAENLKLQDSLRELAALQGKPAPDPGTMRGVMERVMQSAMTEEEATGFEVMWGSAIDAARAGGHWHLNAKQEEELKTQAGTFATRNKISPETMGKWVPLIGKEEDINSPEQMMGKIALMQEMARTGVGHVEPIYKAAKDLRGNLVKPGGGGPAQIAEQLMAIISSATIDADPAAKAEYPPDVHRDPGPEGDGKTGHEVR